MVNTKFVKYWVPALIWATLIFTFSSMPPSPILAVEIPFFDKVLHLINYSIFGYLLLRALLNYGYNLSKRQLLYMAILIGTLYGISDEIHQYFVPDRTLCASDVVFDFFGSTVGAFVYRHGRY